MSDRLEMLVDLCPTCNTIADVGADHGKTALLLIKKNKCKHVIATDISPNAIFKAKSLFEKCGMENKASFIIGDGLDPLRQFKNVDAVLISGMGGETISRILKKDLSELAIPELILSPHTDVQLVQKTIKELEYRFDYECIIEDKKRFYFVLHARRITSSAEETDCIDDDALIKKCTATDVYERYCDWQNKVNKRIPEEYRREYL